MKIGILAFLSETTVDPVTLARKVEALGFESLFFPEHAIIPVHHKVPYPTADGKIPEPYAHFPDPFLCLAMAAAVTSRLQLGTGVCLVPERDPIVLAKEIATLDHYSGGRFLFGIGAGWLADESEIMGVEFRRRWPVTREYIRAMKELWTKPEASFSGEFVKFPPVKSYPKPAHKPYPPLLVGAGGFTWKSDRAIRDAVDWGDGWMPVYMTPAELSGHLATMKELCKTAGRDYSKMDITLTFLQQPELQPSDPRRALEEYGALGVHRFILSPADLSLAQADRVLEDLASKYLR